MKKLILLCICLSGCVATGPAFHKEQEPTGSNALVYIYRPSHVSIASDDANFYVNGIKIATLNPGGYTSFYLPSGQYLFKHKWPNIKDHPVRIYANLAPQTTHYYQLTAAAAPGLGGAQVMWLFVEVSAGTALAQLNSRCKFQHPFDIQNIPPGAPYEEE